jgi:hypothetical protein
MGRAAVRRCHGTTHKANCHPARPLCKARRRASAKYRTCECGAYHFPHRLGSGNCGHPERIWAAWARGQK